ncbi:hypothetical protein MMC22_000086 [Lobaria immixta]|nr:hypothetical protein [Lobaria immixta]
MLLLLVTPLAVVVNDFGNKATYISTNSKLLRRAKKAVSGWFHLNEAEEQALEDDVIATLEAKTKMESDDLVFEPVV